ncbi:MAG: dimethyl sulfoxide reductase anchor subunit [Coriobacteriaceae bacterium]|jgi:anaerobic dimethyl sulfoxide reductase subunit C (anchor subunit)|nr:dimethyl sulfoxide reductase anchor subunit [Coriobacteriaceae bacterium]
MELQWPLIIFTLCVCLAAGTFAGLGILTLLGKGQKLQMPAVVASLAYLAVGGIASFLHLEHADRIFNGFGHITSGITQELIGIVVLFVIAIVYLVLSRRGEIPKWLAVLAVVCGVAMVLVTANSYMMPARPVWSTLLLHVFYLSQAIAGGGATLWLIAALTKADDALQIPARITAIGGLLVVVGLAAYAAYISSVTLPAFDYYFDPTDPTKHIASTSGFGSELLTGSLASYFWGALIIGGAIAAVLGFLKWSKTDNSVPFSAISLVCVVAGGVVFRAALYILGVSVYAFY